MTYREKLAAETASRPEYGLSSMQQALFDALYERPTAFQWVHFTKHGLVRGSVMPGHSQLELTRLWLKENT